MEGCLRSPLPYLDDNAVDWPRKDADEVHVAVNYGVKPRRGHELCELHGAPFFLVAVKSKIK